jgi:hypothetical protein
MKKISWIVLVCFFIAACKKEKVQMNEENFFLIGESYKVTAYYYRSWPRPDPIEVPLKFTIDKNFQIEIKDQDNTILAKGKIKKLHLLKKHPTHVVNLDKEPNNRYNLTNHYFEYYIEIKSLKSKSSLGKELIEKLNYISYQIVPIKKIIDPFTAKFEIIGYEYVLKFNSNIDLLQNKNNSIIYGICYK